MNYGEMSNIPRKTFLHLKYTAASAEWRRKEKNSNKSDLSLEPRQIQDSNRKAGLRGCVCERANQAKNSNRLCSPGSALVDKGSSQSAAELSSDTGHHQETLPEAPDAADFGSSALISEDVGLITQLILARFGGGGVREPRGILGRF